MGLFSRKEVAPANQAVQGEIVQPGDPDYDLDQTMTYHTIRRWEGERPTGVSKDVIKGAIQEMAQSAHLTEDEVKKRLRW